MTDLIDLKWSEIEGEWVIYQEELEEWIKAQGQPKCPVCNNTKAGMRNIRMEGNIKRGNCANCGARLAIIKKPIGSKKMKNLIYDPDGPPKKPELPALQISLPQFQDQ